MRKLLLFLCALLMMGATTLRADNSVTLTFNHDTSQTEANAEVTVNVAGVEGVSATFQQLSDYPYANGALVTNAILCPNVNRNADPTPTIQYEITLTGMPADYTFDTYDMYVHAFASQGNSYQQSLDRTWGVSVQIDGEDFVSDPALDVCKNLVFAQTHTLRSETSKTTGSGTLKLLLTIKGAAGVGCFFGLESITLREREKVEVDYTTRLGITAADWKGASGLCATNFAPAITTADGRTAQLAENYQGNGNATGDLMTQTVTGLPNGTYRVSIYANAFSTHERDGFSTDVQDGDDDVCYVFAGKGNDRVEAFIPARVATSTTVNDLRTLENVVVTDGTLEVGLGKAKAGTNWHTVQVYEITAIVGKDDLIAANNAAYDAVNGSRMNAEIAATLAAAKADLDAEWTNENQKAFDAALAAAQSSVAIYNAEAESVAAAKALVASTNVYTAEAKATYEAIIAEFEEKLNNGTLLTNETFDNPATIHGWRAANDFDDFLTSAWTINDVHAKDFDTSLYINTWSTEGETDGSEFKVPFFEYWVADGSSLSANTITATVNGLEAGLYSVKAWVRVRLKNNSSDPTGITLDLNGGEPTDVTTGKQVGTSQFYLNEFMAFGEVGEDGVLKINFNVADGNNIGWLSFKNVNYAPTTEEGIVYEKALAAINDGDTYRVFVEQNNTKYYLKADGYLTDNAEDATNFTFAAVTVSGKAYETGWNLGCAFTNPDLTNGSTGDVVNDGHLHTNMSQNRDDWERQVFFLNNDGKFAVRATNATGTNWGANTYWDVFEGETLPEAGYSLEPAYVWQLEGRTQETIEIENTIKTLKDVIARGNAFAEEQGDEPLEALNTIDVDAIKTLEEAKAALATAKQAIANYIAILDITGTLDITTGVIANATPVDNLDGWEGTTIGGHDNGVAEYWNVSPAGFHQTITLPAGEYRLTAIALTRDGMHGTIYAGENSVEIVTVANSIVDRRSDAAAWFAAGNGVNELYFTLEETTDIEIGLKADETTGDHWTVWQSFKVEKGSIDYMMAASAYTAALDAAKKALSVDESAIGSGLFQRPEDALDALAAVVEAQTVEDVETATTEELEAATVALLAATEAAAMNVPEEGATYTFQQKASGLYLAVSTEEDKVYITAEPQAFTWTVVEGGYTLSNEEGFVGLNGGNAWTMSALEEKALVINATPVIVDGELCYTLNEKNGMIATDKTEDGEACYADKSIAKSGDMAYWVITKVDDDDTPTAIEGVAAEAADKAIFDLTGRRVSKVQKGIYVINGKKVLK